MQNVNDPTIVADDVLVYARFAITALLAFTTLLSGLSYFRFFETSFGWAALPMALLLACVIEFGKNWGTLKVLRIPFFNGVLHIGSGAGVFFMWFGLLALSVTTFAVSVKNSTNGAHQLSLLLSHERTSTAFSPNTQHLDAQIASLQKSDAELGSLKRPNGKTNWGVQPIKADNAKAIASLQSQREQMVKQQRADYEKQVSIQDNQNQFSAESIMLVGGWVEFLQFILLLIRVAAERSLDRTAMERSVTRATNTLNAPHSNGRHPHPIQNQHPIGFYWPNYGASAAFEPQPLFPTAEKVSESVPQTQQSVPQTNTMAATTHADSVLELCRQAVQRDMANFDNRHANTATVAQRIHAALEKTYAPLKETDFKASYEVGLRLYSYLQGTVWPRLNVIGHPYSNQAFFTERLYSAFAPQKKETQPA